MRRRIYIDPEGPLEDHTNKPYLYDLDDRCLLGLDWCRTGALYDEELWARYKAACAETSRLRGEVFRALRPEPLDAVERRLGLRAQELMSSDGYHRDEMDSLEAEALENAKKQEPK